jgi:hypothetical protein
MPYLFEAGRRAATTRVREIAALLGTAPRRSAA